METNEILSSGASTPSVQRKGGNLLEEEVMKTLDELKAVEEDVNNQLMILDEKIGLGYAAIANNIRQLTDLAYKATEGYVSDETRELMQLGGSIVGGFTEMFGSARAAYKHNQYAKKVLMQKQEIASTGRETLERVRPTVQRQNKNMRRLLENEGRKMYNTAELAEDNKRLALIDNVDKILDAYRLSEYLRLVVEYLIKEYGAWLNGRQSSGMSRPCYYTANINVIDALEKSTGLSAKAVLMDALTGNPAQISGSGVFYLMDSQLSATILSNQEKPVRLQLPSSSFAQGFVDRNYGVKHYVENSNRLRKWHIGALIGGLLTLFVILPCFFYGIWSFLCSDVSLWLSIPASIILVGLVGYGLYFLVQKCRQWISDAAARIIGGALDDGGYVEFEEPDLEHKSVIGAFFNPLTR